jgi:hypothetical protein
VPGAALPTTIVPGQLPIPQAVPSKVSDMWARGGIPFLRSARESGSAEAVQRSSCQARWLISAAGYLPHDAILVSTWPIGGRLPESGRSGYFEGVPEKTQGLPSTILRASVRERRVRFMVFSA